MMNTFENAERLHLRRLEREKQLRIMESISDSDGTFILPVNHTDDKSHAVDALSGLPLAQPPPGHRHTSERPRGRFRWCKNNKFAIIGTVVVIVIIALAFAVGFDVGEDEEAREILDIEKNVVEEPPEESPVPVREDTGLKRYNDLFSQILDWNLTPRTVLEDVASAPGRALNWLAYEDILTVNSHIAGMNTETIRTRYALATLYFSTQKTAFISESIGSSSWIEKGNWLSSFPVCQWYGVVCLDNQVAGQLGLVSELNLTNNGLAGELPNELGLLLLDIQSLDLSSNTINGVIPESLRMLKNLSKSTQGNDLAAKISPAN